jgi:hypothetical protein
MTGRKRARTADHDPPPPTLPPPSRAKSSGMRTSTRQATLPPPRRGKSSRVPTSTRQATLPPPSRGKSSGVRSLTRQAMSLRQTRSTSARGKSSIIPTPTETPPITTSEHHSDGSQDASDAGSSHGGSYTLKGRELVREALKIVNNADSAELMILELMDKHSFNFPRLKELLRGKLVTLFFVRIDD